MIMVYKIIYGIDGCPFDKFFTFADYQSTRGNSYKLFKQLNHLNVRKYSFSQRIVNDWNSLSCDVVQSPLLNQIWTITGLINILNILNSPSPPLVMIWFNKTLS